MADTHRPDLNDIPTGNWVDRFIPRPARPFLRLARADRPLPILLVLLPCWAAMFQAAGGVPAFGDLVVFTLGAILMRSAGCTINDIADRRFDGQVERTRYRPLASGQVKLRHALIFFLVQLLAAALLLVFLTPLTRLVALVVIPLSIIYPFCKRFTYWPQVVLGISFNWGMLMAWAQIQGDIPLGAILMWLGAAAWQVGYDTIYAYVDAQDDAQLGLKSTALLFGENGKLAIAGFYVVSAVCWASGGWLVEMSNAYLIGIALILTHFMFQVYRFDLSLRHANYKLFIENVLTGVLLAVASFLGTL
ncbi:MAG: 4-hydroxybenzoate octaprenyltransferase [Pseudomonadota bacterium]